MLLTAIIVIIIAAMADGREQSFKSQIDSTNQANMTIQEEIVGLREENYSLNQQLDKLNKEAEARSASDAACAALAEAWSLHVEGKADEATQKLAEIDAGALSETLAKLYDAVSAAVSAPAQE